MTNDKKIKETVKNLGNLVNKWNNDVEMCGNQTAFSDRILEQILKEAEKLKQLYK